MFIIIIIVIIIIILSLFIIISYYYISSAFIASNLQVSRILLDNNTKPPQGGRGRSGPVHGVSGPAVGGYGEEVTSLCHGVEISIRRTLFRLNPFVQ